MSIPLWSLLGFAIWTLLVLMAGVGLRRWALVLAGRAQLTDFPGDTAHGSVSYRRAMRAHSNCTENLPVFGAIVVTATLAGMNSVLLDQLAMAVMASRVCQSLTHMVFAETNATVFIRFLFFFAQIVAMFWMATEIVMHVQMP